MLEFCLKMINAFKKERYNDMNEFLQNLKESIIKGYEDAVLYSEQHSKQRFLDMLIKIEFEPTVEEWNDVTVPELTPSEK